MTRRQHAVDVLLLIRKILDRAGPHDSRRADRAHRRRRLLAIKRRNPADTELHFQRDIAAGIGDHEIDRLARDGITQRRVVELDKRQPVIGQRLRKMQQQRRPLAVHCLGVEKRQQADAHRAWLAGRRQQ